MPANHLNWTLAIALSLALAAASLAAPLKPRIVVLTDISPIHVEPDDMQSIIRLFVCADLFEIEGLIATTGWSSAGGNADWIRLIHDAIDAYEKDLPNLRKRSQQEGHVTNESRQEIGYWPSPGYLRSVTVVCSQKRGMRFIGRENNSPGSDRIIKLADEPDERPIWVQAWGGGNTLAQAIWRVKEERTPEQLEAFLKRIRFYTITDQDRGYQQGTPFDVSSHQWLRREFEKDLLFLWDESAWTYQNGTGKRNWDEYATHIQGHGHLGSMYPKYKYGVEGDTPSFLYVLPNGLNEPENPGFGGWGGYFIWGTGPDNTTKAYVNQPGTPAHAISRKYETRFYPAIFNDFVARMDWAKDGAGNRNPVVVINGDSDMTPIKLAPTRGDSITLNASASHDPDGDKLKFCWWVLSEAGTYEKDVKISGPDSARATIVVPSDTAGKSIHVICEVTDDKAPNLTSYRRVVLEPTGAATEGLLPQKPSAITKPRVIILSDFPPLDVIPGGAGHGPAEKRSDPDDVQSMVRFLVYANEFDVEGLVASAGTFANIARKRNVLDILDLYDQVDENLRKHDSRYPTADQLRAVTWQGRDGTWGKPANEIIGEGRDSEASEGIIKVVDRRDPRPVWVCVWGGPCDVAQAIWKVQKTRSPAELERFLSKLRVFLIGLGNKPGQDGSGQWMLDSFPNLFVIVSQKTYAGMFAQNSPIGNLEWLNANVREGHGPLGIAYPPSGFNVNNPGQQEGDTPSFLYLYSAVRGMNDPETPEQESWGGQYIRRDSARKHWYDGPGAKSVSKWLPDMQTDFAARMDWCQAPATTGARP